MDGQVVNAALYSANGYAPLPSLWMTCYIIRTFTKENIFEVPSCGKKAIFVAEFEKLVK